MADPLYGEKREFYYGVTRHDLIPLIPDGTKRMLDVGCSNGDTGAAAKKAKGIHEIVGIELFPQAAQAARQKLDRVLEGDIESLDLEFPEGYFDCILCADVLEHTRNPWAVLDKLRPLLHPDGVLIASIPNIRHFKPLVTIIADRFEYEEWGLLDKTHLRFFTLHTIRKMFEGCRFRIVKIERNYSITWIYKVVRVLSLGLLSPFTVFQFFVIVRRDM
jgi:2-polyprenyl-3-methyl-5-hydroxy-6-metoxy-1,4-benzoquinol methylase